MNDGDVGDDDIFVYTGGDQQVPRDVKRVRISENIDTILREAFRDCVQLIEVEGHGKIKKIEEGAFRRCRRLRWLTKMNGVIEIERRAFGGCNDLSDVEFDKLEIIGSIAFDTCNSLRTINMTSVRMVGWSAFQYCSLLTDAVFGEDLEWIDEAAFRGCTSLRSIAIPLKRSLINDQISSTTGGHSIGVKTSSGSILLREFTKLSPLCIWRAGGMICRKKLNQ